MEGTVRSPDGKPLDGALVAIVPISPGSSHRPTATSISSGGGRFRFDGLASGTYALTATSRGLAAIYRPGLLVDPGRPLSGVVLAFRGPGVTVSGRVRDSRGNGAGGVALLATRSSEEEGDVFEVLTNPDGSYAITLPGGKYTFQTRAGGLASELKTLDSRDLTLDWTLDLRAEEEREAPPEAVSWTREHAIRLNTAEAGHGFEDMQPFKAFVGGARIVALGEATHGTREFFQFKHRMLEFLATEMGFTVFAIEANWPESLAVNDYVVEGTGDPSRALAGLYFWTWNTEEVLEMIRWMRRYNADPRHERKLKFFGFDMQFPAVAAQRALEYLREVDPGGSRRAKRVLAPFRRKDFPISYPKRGEDYRRAIASELTDLLKRFTENKRPFVSRSSAARWARAEHHLRIVWQAEQCRARPSKCPRDRFMAENVQWLLEQEGRDARMVAWAHNGHVSFDAGAYAYQPMGALLRQAYGREYLVLGFAFNRGSFQARAWARDPERRSQGSQTFTVGPAPKPSLDAALARAGIPLFALDLRLLPPDGPARWWWSGRHRARSVGAVFSEAGSDGYFIAQSPVDSYDGLVFVESTTAARPNPIPAAK